MPKLPKDLELLSAVSMSVGAASMCWEPKPKGEFDSQKAEEIAKDLTNWIRTNFIAQALVDQLDRVGKLISKNTMVYQRRYHLSDVAYDQGGDDYKKYAEEKMFMDLGISLAENHEVKWGQRSVSLNYEMGEEGRLKVYTLDLEKLIDQLNQLKEELKCNHACDQKPQQDWEREFDKKFGTREFVKATPDELKQFISTERQRVIEEVREMIEDWYTKAPKYRTKNDLLQELTKLEKED